MTVDEYLRYDERSPVRHEYMPGEVYAMSGVVTSPSTARIDRGEKLTAYRAIPSVRAYLIVDHRRRRVERHWRADATAEWMRDEVVGDGSVPVPCLDVELALDAVYHRVDLATIAEPDVAEYHA